MTTDTERVRQAALAAAEHCDHVGIWDGARRIRLALRLGSPESALRVASRYTDIAEALIEVKTGDGKHDDA